MKYTISQRDDWQIQIVPIAIFLMILGAHMSIFFIFEVKDLSFIKELCMFPLIYVNYKA